MTENELHAFISKVVRDHQSAVAEAQALRDKLDRLRTRLVDVVGEMDAFNTHDGAIPAISVNVIRALPTSDEVMQAIGALRNCLERKRDLGDSLKNYGIVR